MLSSSVDQGWPQLHRGSVTQRSFMAAIGPPERTRECFLSSLLCKVGIKLRKGKAAKVPTALAREELLCNIPEGREARASVTWPLSGH